MSSACEGDAVANRPTQKRRMRKSATGTFVISRYRALDRVAQTIGQNLALTRSAHLRVARDAATAIAHGGCGGRESARCASLSQGGNGCVGGANERAQLPSPRSSPRLRRGFNQQHMPARSVLASVINAMHANPFFEPDRVFN
jgi:hypothetical protein